MINRKARPSVALLALLLALTPCLLSSCASATPSRYEASFFDVFDTYSRVIVYATSKEQADAWLGLAHEQLVLYHKLYDIYHEYADVVSLCELNRLAPLSPVSVDKRTMDLLLFSKEMHHLTGGRTNIAMGSVLSLWHDAREFGLDHPENAALPYSVALRDAALHMDMNDLVLDAQNGTVFFSDPGLRLDVGAVAKGYATERVARTLIENGVTSALLSIGGNVRSIGLRGDGSAYRTAIQNPDLASQQQALLVLELRDQSLVTSGSYQRFYTVDGKPYHHIIDPDTLMPADYLLSVSVVTEDGGLADALSTALFTLPVQKGQALLQTLAGVEAVWVLPDGSVVKSGGL